VLIRLSSGVLLNIFQSRVGPLKYLCKSTKDLHIQMMVMAMLIVVEIVRVVVDGVGKGKRKGKTKKEGFRKENSSLIWMASTPLFQAIVVVVVVVISLSNFERDSAQECAKASYFPCSFENEVCSAPQFGILFPASLIRFYI